MQQPAQRTTVSAQAVLMALAQAHVDYFHSPATKTELLVLLAHSGFETGWWQFMWNNNLGNYKAVPGGAGDWTFFKCNEYVKSIPEAWKTDPRVQITPRSDYYEVWFSPDHPACCFKSFPGLTDGALEYMSRLIERFSVPNDQGPGDAWHWAVQGDTDKFCAALRSHGYFTDDPVHYSSLVKSCKAKLETMNLDFSNLPTYPTTEDSPILHTSVITDENAPDSNS